MKTNLDLDILNNLLDEFIRTLPIILGIIAYAILCWLLFKLILFLANKALKHTKWKKYIRKLNENNSTLTTSLHPTKIILAFVKWFLILLFVVIGADIFGLTMVSGEAGKLVHYLPKLFSAVLIFFLGIYGASVLKKIVQSALKAIDVSGSKAIGLIVFYFIFIIVTITALNQAGVDTTIIANNFTFIISAFLLALALALGLGSREVVLRLLFGFYSRKAIPIGKKIKVGGVEGKVVSINNIFLVLLQESGNKIVVPIKQISDSQVEIFD